MKNSERSHLAEVVISSLRERLMQKQSIWNTNGYHFYLMQNSSFEIQSRTGMSGYLAWWPARCDPAVRTGQTWRHRLGASAAGWANFTLNGRFFNRNHHCSGAILHNLSIPNRNLKKQAAIKCAIRSRRDAPEIHEDLARFRRHFVVLAAVVLASVVIIPRLQSVQRIRSERDLSIAGMYINLTRHHFKSDIHAERMIGHNRS